MCFPPNGCFSSFLIISWSPSNCTFTFGHLWLASTSLSQVTIPFLQSFLLCCGTYLFLKRFLDREGLFFLIRMGKEPCFSLIAKVFNWPLLMEEESEMTFPWYSEDVKAWVLVSYFHLVFKTIQRTRRKADYLLPNSWVLVKKLLTPVLEVSFSCWKWLRRAED